MKIIFLLLFCLIFAMNKSAPCDEQCWISSQPIAQRCNNGYTVNRNCCITNKAAWYTELIPLNDVDSILIAPYSCANPSYCCAGIMENGDVALQCMGEQQNNDAHFSGASASCGSLTFIICKNMGDKNWSCYAKVNSTARVAITNSVDITVTFVGSLQCEYVEQNGTTLLQAGSCVINQQTTIYTHPASKPYAHLSSTNAISFTPILNPFEVDALRSQSGINRIIRRTDAIMGTAYLPIPPPPTPVPNVVDAASFYEFKNTLFWVIIASCLSGVLGCCCQCCFSCMISAELDELKKVQPQKASCNNIPTQDVPTSIYPSPPIEMTDIENKI